MGGAFIEVFGETEEEVQLLLREQVNKAAHLGLIDKRAQIIEKEWPYTTPAGKGRIAPWGGIVHVHS